MLRNHGVIKILLLTFWLRQFYALYTFFWLQSVPNAIGASFLAKNFSKSGRLVSAFPVNVGPKRV